MNVNLIKLFEEAVWVGKVLFNRNKVTGSSANMSFLYQDNIYITRSGACIGNLDIEDFVMVDCYGEILNDKYPSKELPLHISLYEKGDSNINAIIHTHSFYSTIWSMLEHDDINDIIPCYTPYLKMKLGKVGVIEYGIPGTEDLFQSFRDRVNLSDGFILKNHGPIVGGQDMLKAFYILEELEESARIAWELRDKKIPTLL